MPMMRRGRWRRGWGSRSRPPFSIAAPAVTAPDAGPDRAGRLTSAWRLLSLLRGGSCPRDRARKPLILFAPQLVYIPERDQADEGPHPAGDIKHQRIDAGESVHDQAGRAPGKEHDDGARQQGPHDSSLVAGRHDGARVWLVIRKLRLRLPAAPEVKRFASPR